MFSFKDMYHFFFFSLLKLLKDNQSFAVYLHEGVVSFKRLITKWEDKELILNFCQKKYLPKAKVSFGIIFSIWSPDRLTKMYSLDLFTFTCLPLFRQQYLSASEDTNTSIYSVVLVLIQTHCQRPCVIWLKALHSNSYPFQYGDWRASIAANVSAAFCYC